MHLEPSSTHASLAHSLHQPAMHTMSALRRYWFILNPAANHGKAKRYVKPLQYALKARKVDTTIQLTTKPHDATEFARAIKCSVDTVVACGGDGTFNETAQSLIHSDTALGCIPMGSGNDFYSNLSCNSVPRRIRLESAIEKVLCHATHTIDTGQVSFQRHGFHVQRAFLNSLGIGFTGEIARVAKLVPHLRGDLIYLYALWIVARTHRAAPMTFELHTPDGIQTITENVFSVMIGNGRREGGKFWIAPEADMRDGWLDICILKAFPMFHLPKWVLAFMRGEHIHTSQVIYTKIKHAVVHLSRPESMHLDGEVYECVQGCIRVSVMPNSLHVVAI